MPKLKKPFNLTSKIVVHLRAIHRGWPNANLCFKNNKSENKRIRCDSCDKDFRKEYMRKDHTYPIGLAPQLINGAWLPSWDSYINSFFAGPSDYQALCIDCHEVKTVQDKKNMALERKRRIKNEDNDTE